MALAPFFDKAALAASQILKDFNLTTFTNILNNQVIGLYFDDSVVISSEGVNTIELAVNLLARLYPRISIVATGKKTNQMVSRLCQQAREINPKIEISASLSEMNVCLVIGNSKPQTTASNIYIGSTGWIASVSTHKPVGSGCTENPFGAGAAACFGAANIFRIIFKEYLHFGDPDDGFSLSLLNYETEPNKLSNPELPLIDLGETHLIGLGAIGNGAVWGLAKVPKIQGTLHLIDDENVEISNCQRYVLTTSMSVGKHKVDLAADQFCSTDIHAIPHTQRWGEYLNDRNNWSIQCVGVAVDSYIDRCAVQASLPRWIANAWTQTLNLGVSRHDFLGDQACLMCLYLPESGQKSEDQLIAESIGLPECIMEIREMLHSGKRIGEEFITRIGAALTVPVESLMQYSDQPLRVFYSKEVCGGIVLSLGADYSKTSRIEAPMAFQSALAGIMLAAELIAHAGGLKQGLQPARTIINLLRPIGDFLSINEQKHTSGFCICQDQDYISNYKQKFSLNKK